MKRFLAVLLLTLATVPSMAQHWHGHGFRHHGHHGYYYGGNGGWVAPLIIGGVVGAAIVSRPTTQTETVIVQQPSVIVQRQPVCTEWKEIQNSDGTIYRERTCTN